MTLSVRTLARVFRAVHVPVRAGLRVLGVPSPVVATRRGVTYELDLDEAIDVGLFLAGAFEPQVSRALDRVVRPGQVVLDIGANIGAHTLRLAQRVGPAGRVVAFEPTAFAFDKLTRNVALNPALARRIQCERVGLVDADGGVLPVHVSASWSLTRPLDDVNPRDMGFGHSTAGAHMTTLDRWVDEAGLPRIDTVKLDVDGFEVRVLRGAQRTLAQHRPVVVMEWAPHHYVWPGEPFIAAVELLRDLGYRFARLDGRPLVGAPDALARAVPARVVENVLALP